MGVRRSPDGARRPRRAHSHRRHVGDYRFDIGKQLIFRQRRAALRFWKAPGRPLGDVRARNADRLADGFHGEPSLDRDIDRNLFFDSVRQISFSNVFLPREAVATRRFVIAGHERRSGNDFLGLRRQQRALFGEPPPCDELVGRNSKMTRHQADRNARLAGLGAIDTSPATARRRRSGPVAFG
jgi:hypothetical protein